MHWATSITARLVNTIDTFKGYLNKDKQPVDSDLPKLGEPRIHHTAYPDGKKDSTVDVTSVALTDANLVTDANTYASDAEYYICDAGYRHEIGTSCFCDPPITDNPNQY